MIENEDFPINFAFYFFISKPFSEINCGHPGSIKNGDIHGTTYTYGTTVSYTCHGGYLLVDGSSSRTCQLSAIVSGTKPRCACKLQLLCARLY